jgi:hypothetical protein
VDEFGVAHDPCLLEESDAVVHGDTTLAHGVDELVCLVHAVNLVETLELLAAVSESLLVSGVCIHSVEFQIDCKFTIGNWILQIYFVTPLGVFCREASSLAALTQMFKLPLIRQSSACRRSSRA